MMEGLTQLAQEQDFCVHGWEVSQVQELKRVRDAGSCSAPELLDGQTDRPVHAAGTAASGTAQQVKQEESYSSVPSKRTSTYLSMRVTNEIKKHFPSESWQGVASSCVFASKRCKNLLRPRPSPAAAFRGSSLLPPRGQQLWGHPGCPKPQEKNCNLGWSHC